MSHAFLRGVCDPTSKLPHGNVFVTGVINEETLGDEIFVTRSPCIKWSDGKMLQIVTRKPNNMTNEEFSCLRALPFGAIIFACPHAGFKPIPEMIAGGDLDGDRYFVCWEKEIISVLERIPQLKHSKPLDRDNFCSSILYAQVLF